ncbi:MAG: hypothetical protein ACOC91_03220 [bacterium]
MNEKFSIPGHEMDPELRDSLEKLIAETVSHKIQVRVKQVLIEIGVNDEGDEVVNVTILIEKWPEQKGWMFDAITTATGALQAKGVRAIPFINAYA